MQCLSFFSVSALLCTSRTERLINDFSRSCYRHSWREVGNAGHITLWALGWYERATPKPWANMTPGYHSLPRRPFINELELEGRLLILAVLFFNSSAASLTFLLAALDALLSHMDSYTVQLPKAGTNSFRVFHWQALEQNLFACFLVLMAPLEIFDQCLSPSTRFPFCEDVRCGSLNNFAIYTIRRIKKIKSSPN